MTQEKRIFRSRKGVSDDVAILFEAMGVNCKPYPVVTAGAKDPFLGWFGASRKQFSDAPKACTKAETDSDLAAMRVQTAEVLELVKAALPASTKHLRVVLGIPVCGNRIRKKLPVPKKPKTFKVPKASVSAESCMMPATPNGMKPVSAVRTPSPKNAKVKIVQSCIRRSPRIKNSQGVSY
ncbi:hypothetical protein B9Z19DRAFT_1089618 [Tuber borchii]|uniref:Uncharacterized protein n=1 Tax=Tuber borchii TaxID=42251 RepID=A0A2T6ZJS4_TUBBO|nr:hypothetical protein B9Z19DRAFT_1089618 [Tuber borchii]